MSVKHTTTASGVDSGNGLISKNAWNADHSTVITTLQGTSPRKATTSSDWIGGGTNNFSTPIAAHKASLGSPITLTTLAGAAITTGWVQSIDGTTAVGVAVTNNVYKSFIWDLTANTAVATVNNFSAYNISGTRVVGYDMATTRAAYLNTSSPSTYTYLAMPYGASLSSAYGVAGVWAAGTSGPSGGAKAMAWNLAAPSAAIRLGYAPWQTASIVRAVNGTLACGASLGSGYSAEYAACLWDLNNPMAPPTMLGRLSDTKGSYSYGMSNQWVVGADTSTANVTRAVVWNLDAPDVAIVLGTVSGQNFSEAYSVADTWVVGEADTASSYVGVMWDLTSPTSAPTQLWTGGAAYALSLQSTQTADPSSPASGDLAIGIDESVWLYANNNWVKVKP